MKLRTYPRVDLVKVSNWINALTDYGLPLIEISSRRLTEREKRGSISPILKERLLFWKKSKGLEDQDDLEYKYFLEGIGAIRVRTLRNEDIDMPLVEDVRLGDIPSLNSRSVKIYYLSRLGSMLSQYWNSKQHHFYEAMLFWLLIRSVRFNPLIQRILSDRRFYQDGLQDELIPSKDGISRSLVRKWLYYFGLLKQSQLNQPKLATFLLYAVAQEINEQLAQRGKFEEYVDNLCLLLSERFTLSEAAIDFSIILDCLHSNLDRQVISGFPSGRGHRGLPSKPTVQILEISSQISLSSIQLIHSFEVQKAMNFGVDQ